MSINALSMSIIFMSKIFPKLLVLPIENCHDCYVENPVCNPNFTQMRFYRIQMTHLTNIVFQQQNPYVISHSTELKNCRSILNIVDDITTDVRTVYTLSEKAGYSYLLQMLNSKDIQFCKDCSAFHGSLCL